MNSIRTPLGRVVLALAPLLFGLAASAMLLTDYLRPVPVFCALDGGCAFLRGTHYARVFGVPTPAFGVAGFALLTLLSLMRGGPARVALLVLALAGALVGLVLILIQIRMNVYCLYCLVADTSLLAVAAVAAHRYRRGWDLEGRRLAVGGGVALALALAAPMLVGALKRPSVPLPIARELAAAPRDKVTVIDFIDFECPFCRSTHEAFAPLLAEHRARVHIVRKHVPLPQHPHALPAARAACCGERLGRGDAIADALVAAPVQDLTAEGCEKVAVSVGIDLGRFRACLADPDIDARIRADTAAFRAAGARGLPTIWVGIYKLEGMQTRETLERALSGALARVGS